MATSRKQVVGKYELGKVLASGYFDCRTRICTHIVTGAQYVVRIYSKSTLAEAQWMWDRTRDAIHVMRTLPKHENIIEIAELFETESSLYILMQLFAPMHLTKMYTSAGESGHRENVPIQRTKMLFLQVVRGLRHMHDCSVVHLGLAPDHVMVNNRDHVKIGNLVSCKSVPKGTKLCRDIRGTMHTVAPEVLRNGEYDPYLADSWSMGVLLYFMLHQGRYPHDGANTTKNILYNRIRPPDPKLPAEALDLLQLLLSHNPNSRMRVEHIADHPFFTMEHRDVELGGMDQHLPRCSVMSTRRVSKNSHLAVPKTSLNVRAQYCATREDAAAYRIQECYRNYRIVQRQLNERFMNSQTRGSISRNRGLVVEAMPPSSRPGRKKSYHFDQSGVETSHEHDKTQIALKTYQRRWGTVTNPDNHREEVESGRSSNDSCSIRYEEKLTESLDDGSSFALGASRSGGNPHENTLCSRFDYSLDSNHLPPPLPPVRRHGSCKHGYDLMGDVPFNGSINKALDTRDGLSPAATAVPNDTGRVAPCRSRNTSGLYMKVGEPFARDLDPKAPVPSLFNLKIDPGRRCPVCDRPPAQRMNRREPYLDTSYKYKNGEFTAKYADDSD